MYVHVSVCLSLCVYVRKKEKQTTNFGVLQEMH